MSSYEFFIEQYGTKNLEELAQLLYKEASKEYPIVAIYAYKHSVSGDIEIQTCGNEEEIKELYSSPYVKKLNSYFQRKNSGSSGNNRTAEVKNGNIG